MIYIVWWKQTDNGFTLALTNSTDDGSTFPGKLSIIDQTHQNSSSIVSGPLVNASSDGTSIIMAWGNSSGVWFANSTDYGKNFTVRRISNNIGITPFSGLSAAISDSNIYITWPAKNGDTLFTRSTNNGMSFGVWNVLEGSHSKVASNYLIILN